MILAQGVEPASRARCWARIARPARRRSSRRSSTPRVSPPTATAPGSIRTSTAPSTTSTRLTLLSAPPGYGKSVAVAGWLGSRGVPHAWLSLDAADNDPARFLRYLVGALQPVRPGSAARPPALIEGAAGPEHVLRS